VVQTYQRQAESTDVLHSSSMFTQQFGSLNMSEPPAAAAASDNLQQQLEHMRLAAADASRRTELQVPSAACTAAVRAASSDRSIMQLVCSPPVLHAPAAASTTRTADTAAAAAGPSSSSAVGSSLPPQLNSSSDAAGGSSSAGEVVLGSSSSRIAGARSGSGSGSGTGIFQFTATREVTRQVVTTTTITDTLTLHAAPAAAVGASSSSRGGAGSSITSLEPQQRVGVLGEAFAFSLLQYKLTGFDESCWHSSAQQYWPYSDAPLQPRARDPSYNFLYRDVHGELSGTPGTLCFVECKATSDDAAADGSGVSTRDFPISRSEWQLARLVKHQSTPQQPGCMCWCVWTGWGSLGGRGWWLC
jgi:hypothetical protein